MDNEWGLFQPGLNKIEMFKGIFQPNIKGQSSFNSQVLNRPKPVWLSFNNVSAVCIITSMGPKMFKPQKRHFEAKFKALFSQIKPNIKYGDIY